MSGRGLNAVAFADLGNKRMQKKWLVAGIFGAAEIAVLYGPPGCGKSKLADDLTYHVGAGLPWFGHNVERCAVLFLSLERGAVTARRLMASKRTYGTDAALDLVGERLNLRNPSDDVDRVLAHMDKMTGRYDLPVGLVVIDTLHRALDGADENSSAHIGQLIANLERIRQTGATVLGLHHVPLHDPGRMRGHSSLLAAADMTIRMQKRGSVFAATVDKMSDGQGGERISFRLDTVELAPATDDMPATTAPIVVPVEATEQTKAPVLSPADRIALRELKAAYAKGGQLLPEHCNAPTGTIGIDVADWKKLCIQARITTANSRETQKRVFTRAKRNLLDAGVVMVEGDFAWPIQ